jgi:hypothetical protein
MVHTEIHIVVNSFEEPMLCITYHTFILTTSVGNTVELTAGDPDKNFQSGLKKERRESYTVYLHKIIDLPH